MFEQSLFNLCLLALAPLIFLPALIIGSVGAHRLITTQRQQRVYTGTTCFIANITEQPLPYDCNCDGCHPSTCYAEHFSVHYQIENGTTIFSMIHIDQIPNLLKLQVHICFFLTIIHRKNCV